VALHGDVLAVLCQAWPLELFVLRRAEDGVWRPLGRGPVRVDDQELDGNDIHVVLDTSTGATRIAFGGTGFVGYEEQPNDPGFVAVYAYDEELEEWRLEGRHIVRGVRKENFAQGLAFSGDWLALSSKDREFGNGNMAVHLYRFVED